MNNLVRRIFISKILCQTGILVLVEIVCYMENELVAFLEIVPTPLNEDMVCWSRGSAELIKNSECILRVHIEKMMRRYNTTYEFYQGFNPPFECVSHMSPSEAWAFHIDLDLNRLRMKLAVFMTIITLIFND